MRGATRPDHAHYPPRGISIHAPLAGRDLFRQDAVEKGRISIHAPLAGRDVGLHALPLLDGLISIHAPLAGRDIGVPAAAAALMEFQSTRPLRGATTSIDGKGGRIKISIHAPLAGRDSWWMGVQCNHPKNFNPRAPCGARPITGRSNALDVLFQSTRPLRGATFLPFHSAQQQ